MQALWVRSRLTATNISVFYIYRLHMPISLEGTVWRTSRQVYLLCHWGGHLAEFPHLGVVDRWPATPMRARYSAMVAFP